MGVGNQVRICMGQGNGSGSVRVCGMGQNLSGCGEGQDLYRSGEWVRICMGVGNQVRIAMGVGNVSGMGFRV